jgi:PIN domain nuclease of toxin-antitoxin system
MTEWVTRRACPQRSNWPHWARVPPLSLAHTVAAGRLPRHHEDPFARMLMEGQPGIPAASGSGS